jgi:hypothetical protein
MRATLCFIRIIRWQLTIRACMAIHRISPRISDFLCQVTGLDSAYRSGRASLDRREAGSEPPSALQAKS